LLVALEAVLVLPTTHLVVVALAVIVLLQDFLYLLEQAQLLLLVLAAAILQTVHLVPRLATTQLAAVEVVLTDTKQTMVDRVAARIRK
jgi:hypothetical protein